MEKFVLSVTTDLWATIYRRRKNCRDVPMPWYDKAAAINVPREPGKPPRGSFDHLAVQDQAVKEIFREMVDYISQVKPD